MSTAHSSARSAHPHLPVLALVVGVLTLACAAAALGWVLTREDSAPATGSEGSGVAVAETRDVGPFRDVVLSGANQVSIGVGGEQLVVVRGDDNLVGLVSTEVQSGALVVDETGNFETVTPMSVEITVPSLDEVRLSGSGTIRIDGHELDSLAVALPGSGRIVGAGAVETLIVEISGSGEVDLGELVARDATVDLSGSGSVLLHVTGALAVEISGTGSVTYTGDPDRVDRDISGTGSVTGS